MFNHCCLGIEDQYRVWISSCERCFCGRRDCMFVWTPWRLSSGLLFLCFLHRRLLLWCFFHHTCYWQSCLFFHLQSGQLCMFDLQPQTAAATKNGLLEEFMRKQKRYGRGERCAREGRYNPIVGSCSGDGGNGRHWDGLGGVASWAWVVGSSYLLGPTTHNSKLISHLCLRSLSLLQVITLFATVCTVIRRNFDSVHCDWNWIVCYQ